MYKVAEQQRPTRTVICQCSDCLAIWSAQACVCNGHVSDLDGDSRVLYYHFQPFHICRPDRRGPVRFFVFTQ